MRKYLKFNSLGIPGGYAVDTAGEYLVCINDIAGWGDASGGTDSVILLNQLWHTDSATGWAFRCTNGGSGIDPGPIVYEAIMAAITATPGGHVDLQPFLPAGYNILSWEYQAYIV